MKTRLIMAVLVLMAGLLVLASQCTNDNVRPVALFTVDRVDGPSPLTVNFDGSGSYDPDGTIEAYSWNFGDGTFGTGVTTSHTFSSSTARTYTVKLTVTDDAGKTGSMSGSIVVTSSPNGTTLFFDDFDDVRDPNWASTPNWKIKDGRYWYGSTWGKWGYSYVVTGTAWGDYAVEADIEVGGSSYAGFILRVQEDLNNMVIVYGDHGQIVWSVKVDGETVLSSAPTTPGFFSGSQHVRVEVSGSSYKLFIEGLLRSTFNDLHFSTGMPGVIAYEQQGVVYAAAFDNFRVTSLP